MKELFLTLVTGTILVGCSHTISMIHTEGHAEDVIDDTKTTSTDVSPNLSIPATSAL